VFGPLAVERINGQAFRGVIPRLAGVRLENRDDGRGVDVILRLRAVTAEIADGSGFRPVAPTEMIEWPLTVRGRVGETPALTFELTLKVQLVGGRPFPVDILPLLGIDAEVPLPINELTRTRMVTVETDEGPVAESRAALGFNVQEVGVKATDAGLCVGIGVGYLQDGSVGTRRKQGYIAPLLSLACSTDSSSREHSTSLPPICLGTRCQQPVTTGSPFWAVRSWTRSSVLSRVSPTPAWSPVQPAPTQRLVHQILNGAD
jgi:hypothetical protein